MNTLKAILLMAIWTSILGATLYFSMPMSIIGIFYGRR